MSTKEYIHEAQYVAEVGVTLIENDHTWAPYFSIEDVRKLEAVRRARRRALSLRQPSSRRFMS
jgi:hypothetical protein